MEKVEKVEKMRTWHCSWNVALEALRAGYVATRFDSVWKGQEMRMGLEGKFETRRLVEGILEGCEPHWTDWKLTDRHTYPANLEATDWIVWKPEAEAGQAQKGSPE